MYHPGRQVKLSEKTRLLKHEPLDHATGAPRGGTAEGRGGLGHSNACPRLCRQRPRPRASLSATRTRSRLPSLAASSVAVASLAAAAATAAVEEGALEALHLGGHGAADGLALRIGLHLERGARACGSRKPARAHPLVFATPTSLLFTDSATSNAESTCTDQWQEQEQHENANQAHATGARMREAHDAPATPRSVSPSHAMQAIEREAEKTSRQSARLPMADGVADFASVGDDSRRQDA